MRKISRFLVLLFVMILAVGTISITASAATKKIPAQAFTARYSEVKKFVTVKKGTTTLKLGTVKNTYSSRGEGYAYFKVPKTGIYSFKFSNLTPAKKVSYSNGFVGFYKNNNGYFSTISNLKTKGGKSYALHIANKNNQRSSIEATSDLKTRTGKVKLKKGEKVYMYFYFDAKASIKLNITSK